MNLREYLETNNLSVLEFCLSTELPTQNVYYWIRGKFVPNRFYKRIIAKLTNGQVTEKDWKKQKKEKGNGIY